MKRFKLALLMLFFIAILPGCGGKGISSDTEKGSIVHGSEGYTADNPQETVSNITINQNSIIKYKIIYPLSSIVSFAYSIEAKRLADKLNEKYEYQLSVSNDSAAEDEYEILIGPTNREESNIPDAFKTSDYSMTVEGKKVSVRAGSLNACRDAVTKLLKLFDNPPEKIDIADFQFSDSCESYANMQRPENTGLRVMTYNVHSHQGSADLFPVKHRMLLLAETIETYLPDVICLQEMTDSCRFYLLPYITKYYTEAVIDKVTNETPIFFLTDLFTLVEAGFEAFVPDRSISWAVLKNNSTGVSYGFTSCHYSFCSGASSPQVIAYRIGNADLQLKIVNDLRLKYNNIDIFCGGDYFNGKKSAQYAALIEGGLLDSAASASLGNMSDVHTPHYNGTLNDSGSGPDFIIYKSDYTKALKHVVVVKSYYVLWTSDHSPVFSDFQLNS